MSQLFSPIAIRNVTLKNRISMSPMCQYSSEDGFVNDWHIAHYGSRSVGGAGLVIVEATAVAPEGRITPGDLGIWDDDRLPGLTRLAGFISSNGAVPGIQIAHAGRKASCAVPWKGGMQLDNQNGGWQTVAPSPVPYLTGDMKPYSLDNKGIMQVVRHFSEAASRALKAGFKVVEIHSAHGYLFHEFLSPLSNHRTDEYGGSFENRTRLLMQVVEAVRSEWPADNPLFVRISSTDWTEGGWTIDDSVKLAAKLKDSGVDLIDCSSGGNVFDAKVPFGPGYQVPFAGAIKNSGILTAAVGLITDARQAESILTEGKADLITMGRELLRNPYFPLKAAAELGEETEWPAQYLRAKKR